MSEQQDKKVVACNYIVPTKVAVKGALCYISHSSGGAIGEGNVEVLIRSRGGRHILKWERIKRLGNFRVKTIPPNNPRYSDERIRDYGVDELLTQLKVIKQRDGDALEASL